MPYSPRRSLLLLALAGLGLQRAFLYAGTPAAITTLWRVDDRASFVLMREFYDRLAPNADAAAALQGA